MAYQPKSYKKFIATAATATLVATAIVPVASAADAKSFKDVSSTYKVAVDYLVANDITKGMTETTFGTTKSITRGDAAIMIAKALKLNTTTAANAGFKDVNARVAGAVNAVVEAKIASGTSKTTFNPDANITRQEMAKMIANAYKLDAGTTKNDFKDVNNNWDAYVDALLANGITLGKTPTTFAATASVTRGEFALFVYRSETLVPAVAVEKVTVVNETTTTVAVKVANKELKASDFKVLVNGVAVSPTKVESDAKGEVYTITHASLKDTKGIVSVNGKQANFDFVNVDPKVESVKAINGKQVEVKFSQAIDATTVITGGNLNTTNLDVTPLTTNGVSAHVLGTIAADLSTDGKTLTLTAGGSNYFDGKYNVTVKANAVLTTTGDKIPVFTSILSVNDTERPTVSAVTYLNNQTARISFSEPLASKGTVSYALADGTAVTTATETLGSDYIDVNLTNVGIPVNQAITVTLIGATDSKGNLATPNPLKVTVQKNTNDVTAPTFTVTATTTKTFDVKFSEALDEVTPPTVVGDSVGATTIASFIKDSNDPTLYHATLTAPTSGLQTVTFAPNKFYDKSLNGSAAYSKVINFDVNTNGPKVLSTKVEKIGGIENLVVTFDKNVTVVDAKNISGTFVKDSVTSPVTIETDTAAAQGVGASPIVDGDVSLYNPVSGKSKSIAISLANAADGTYAVTLPTGLVKDEVTGVDSDATTNIAFTRTSDTNTSSPNVTSVVPSATNNNKVVVTFDRKLDAASALNKANYTIEGATVENAILTSNGATATVELTLVKDSSTFTGLRVANVTNVKSSFGVVQNSYVANVSFKENVRPTVTKAALTSVTEIRLTTSENVFNASGTDDFDVFAGGVKLSGVTTALVTGTAAKTLVITVPTLSPAQVSAGLVVKPTSTININDATLANPGVETTGNALNFTSINVQ